MHVLVHSQTVCTELFVLAFSDLLHDFPDLDGDEDDLLSPREFLEVYHGDEEVFHLLDIDHNGELTKKELQTTIDHLQESSKDNGGVDKNWLSDQQKSRKADLENNLEDGDSKSKDDSFNWQDYV